MNQLLYGLASYSFIPDMLLADWPVTAISHFSVRKLLFSGLNIELYPLPISADISLEAILTQCDLGKYSVLIMIYFASDDASDSSSSKNFVKLFAAKNITTSPINLIMYL